MTVSKAVEDIFHRGGGYATVADLASADVSKYYLKNLVEANIVSKIKRGLYRLNEPEMQADELVEVCAIIPKGILCLYSAWSFYDLTTYVPHEHHIAIEKNTRVLIPDYPPIKLYRWQQKYWEIGIKTINETGEIRVYDLEKSACDAVKYRNKVGKDMMLEVLKNYAALSERNLNKLMQYARLLRVENIIRLYLEPLL